MNKKINLIFISLITGFAVIYFYSFFHEIGHGIIGMIAGGKIVKIKLGFNSFISISGANYTYYSHSLMNLFGLILPLKVLFLLLIIYNKEVKNVCYHIFYFVYSIVVTCSTVPWIVIPIMMYHQGNAPDNYDVTNFLSNSNLDVTKFLTISDLPVLLVCLASLSLFIKLLAIIFVTKKIPQNYIKVAQNYANNNYISN